MSQGVRAHMRRDLDWIDVPDMLTALGIAYTRSGDELNFSCFGEAHTHGDKNPSARMNARTSAFMCHNPSCGMRGDAVTFIVKLKDLTESESLRVLSERYGGPERSVEEGGLAAEVERIRAAEGVQVEERIPPDEAWVMECCAESRKTGRVLQYLYNRGFIESINIQWLLGEDQVSGRLVIPVRDHEGNLVGAKGRAIDPENTLRYLVLGDPLGGQVRYGFNTYRKSDYVFGLDRMICADQRAAILCEGELNVIALAQMGQPAVGVAGSEFSARQAELIREHLDSVVVYFDGDDAGLAGTWKVIRALEPYMQVSVVVGAPGDAAEIWRDCLPYLDAAVPSLQWRLDQG